MRNFSNTENTFPMPFSAFARVGYHGTSLAAALEIESRGFLPTKILQENHHHEMLFAANALGIDVTDYCEWLSMHSVTFTADFADALNHLRSGHLGGQGLGNFLAVASQVRVKGSEEQKDLAARAATHIDSLRKSSGMIYAVDLSDFGPRLVSEGNIYHYYWDPNARSPTTSDIGPDRLIARLDVC